MPDTRLAGNPGFEALPEFLATVQAGHLKAEATGHRHMDRNDPRNG
jgi:hypothetical protein